MVHLLQALPALSSALACFGRIQDYINISQRHDYREITAASLVSTLGPVAVFQYTDDGRFFKSISENTEFCERDINSAAIIVKNGSFGLGDKSKAILRNISCEISTGHVVMIVGPTGSGKSTMLRAFLGEAVKLDGSVKLSSTRIGFCDQTPRLTNGSVRDNIIGTRRFEEAWFQTVIHACVLDDELQELSYDFEATIGSHGDRLSGGQKQRLVNWNFVARHHYSPC